MAEFLSDSGRREKRLRSTHAAYLIAKSWLADDFPSKLLVVKSWEDVKACCDHFPTPAMLGAFAVGIAAYTTMAAVAEANRLQWGSKVLDKNAVSESDIVLLSPDHFTSDVVTLIKERVASHRAAVAAKSSHRRAGAANNILSDILDEPENDGQDPILGLSLVGPAPAPGPAAAPAATDDDAPDASALTGLLRTQQSQILTMQQKIAQLEHQLLVSNSQVFELQGLFFDPCAVALYNLPMRDRELDPLGKVKSLFLSLGLEVPAQNLTSVEKINPFLCKLVFSDAAAARATLDNARVLRAGHWESSADAPTILPGLSAIHKKMKEIYQMARKDFLYEGLLFVQKWSRVKAAPKPDGPRSRPPSRDGSQPDLPGWAL